MTLKELLVSTASVVTVNSAVVLIFAMLLNFPRIASGSVTVMISSAILLILAVTL